MTSYKGPDTAVFVFQPGGTSDGENVYTTEVELSAATTGKRNHTIVWDLALVGYAYTFVTVGTIDFGINATWTDGNGGGSDLVFANGTVLANLWGVLGPGLAIVSDQATDVFTLTTFQAMEVYGYSAFNINSTGNIVTIPSGLYITVIVNDDTLFANTTFAGRVFNPQAGSALYLYANDASIIENSAFPAVPAGFVQLLQGSPNVFQIGAFYPYTYSSGFIVGAGNVLATLPPANCNGAVLFTNNHLYYSTGAAWVLIA